MPLIQYHIDFSNLSIAEKSALVKRIEPFTDNCIHWNPDFKTGTFELDGHVTLEDLRIPPDVAVRRTV